MYRPHCFQCLTVCHSGMDHVALYDAQYHQGTEKAYNTNGGKPERTDCQYMTVDGPVQDPGYNEIEQCHHAHGHPANKIDVRMGERIDHVTGRAGFPQPLGDTRKRLYNPLYSADEQVDDGQNHQSDNDIVVGDTPLFPDQLTRCCPL